MRGHCLWHALDLQVLHGGSLELVQSTHWGIYHVRHRKPEDAHPSHFIPHEDLKQPWHSVFGFGGKVVYRDKDELGRGPMKPELILVSVVLGVIIGACWYITRKLQRRI